MLYRKSLFAWLFCLLLAPALRAQRSIENAEAETWLTKKPGGRVLDGRPEAAFTQSHLPGAELLPADDSSLRRFLSGIPAKTSLLVYGKNGKESEALARRLRRAGYRPAGYLNDGIAGWHRNGYPLEGAGQGLGMTRAAFDSLLQTGEVLLVDFFADWCGYCPPVSESADRLAREHAGALTVLKIDADLHPDLCASLGINRFPTLHLYQMGRHVWRQVGYLVHENIAFKVRRALREQMPELPGERPAVEEP